MVTRLYVLAAVSLMVFAGCKKDFDSKPNTVARLFYPLKEIVIPNLPSPFYQFEYDSAGNLQKVNYASDLFKYDVFYNGGRLSEVRNNILVNKDRLLYYYDIAGRLDQVNYHDSTGFVFEKVNLFYAGGKLIKMQWRKLTAIGFTEYKTLYFTYYTDGNLRRLTEHRPASSFQEETNFIDDFEQYDNKTNVDDFMLLHNDFFEHFVIVPQVQLQRNNPGRVTRTGDGINYVVDYTWQYNSNGLPIHSSGELIVTNGTNAGTHFQTSIFYSYY